MGIVKQTDLADLIAGSGLVGATPTISAATSGPNPALNACISMRPVSAPLHGSSCSSSFPTRTAGSSATRQRSPSGRAGAGRPASGRSYQQSPGVTSSLQAQHTAAVGGIHGDGAAADATKVAGITSTTAAAGLVDPILSKRMQQLQQQLQESRGTQQQLQAALQEAEAAAQAAAADAGRQQGLLARQFKQIKALEAEKDALLASKRTLLDDNKQLAAEVLKLQGSLAAQQQQLEEAAAATAAANQRAEEAARRHQQQMEALRKATAQREQELQQKLTTKESLLHDTESTLRGELLRRTATILSMQAQIEQQDADLEAQRHKQQQLQQPEQGQQAEEHSAGQQQGSSGSQGQAGDTAGDAGDTVDVLEAGASDCSSTGGDSDDVEAAVAEEQQEQAENRRGAVTPTCRHGHEHHHHQQHKARPVTSAPPGYRHRHPALHQPGSNHDHQQQQQQGSSSNNHGDSSSSSSSSSMVEHLTQQLVTAQAQLARCREQHAQQLQDLSHRLAAAESAQHQGIQGLGSIYHALAERTAALLASRTAAAPLPFYRPPSGHYQQHQRLHSRPVSGCSSSSTVRGSGLVATAGGGLRHSSRPQSAVSTVTARQYQYQQQQHPEQQQVSPSRQRPQSAYSTTSIFRGDPAHHQHHVVMEGDSGEQPEAAAHQAVAGVRGCTSPSRPGTASTWLSPSAAATEVFSDVEEDSGSDDEVEEIISAAAAAGRGGATCSSSRASSPLRLDTTVDVVDDTVGEDSDTPDISGPKDLDRAAPTLFKSLMQSQQQPHQQQQKGLSWDTFLLSELLERNGGSGKAGKKGQLGALQLLCDRLMSENAYLLAELAKWESGAHSCQVYGPGYQEGVVAEAGATTLVHHSSSTTSTSIHTTGGHGRPMSAASAVTTTVTTTSTTAAIAAAAGGSTLPGQPPLSRPASAATVRSRAVNPATPSRMVATGRYLGAPVHDALRLAVRSALEAAKGELLPLALTPSTLGGAEGGNSGSGSSGGGGWAAAGGSRLEAALSAAAVNIKLRARVVELEAAVLAAKASAASDESTVLQQKALLHQQASELLQLRGQLANARAELQVQLDKARAAIAVAAAAAVKKGGAGAGAGEDMSPGVGAAAGGRDSTSRCMSRAQTLHPSRPVSAGYGGGAAAAAAAGAGGGGCGGPDPAASSQQRSHWPAAAVDEVARLKAAADAAARDKAAKERQLQQLQRAHNSLAAKLLSEKQRLGRKDTLILAMQQQLAAAHMSLLDHNLELPASNAASSFAVWGPSDPEAAGDGSGGLGSTVGVAAMAAAGFDHAAAGVVVGGGAEGTKPGPTGQVGTISSGSSCRDDVAAADDQAATQHNSSSSRQNPAMQRRPWSASTAGLSRSSSIAGPSDDTVSVSAAVTGGPLSFTAAMDSRKWERECRRLHAVVNSQAEQLEASKREAQRLQRQLSQHHASSQAALAAAARQSRSQRESLAGDLDGATTAMQDAVRRLAASEQKRAELSEALTDEQRRVQQLRWDVAYLRQRAAAAQAAARASEAASEGVEALPVEPVEEAA